MKSRTKCYQQHTQRRALERAGVRLSKWDIEDIVNKIKSGASWPATKYPDLVKGETNSRHWRIVEFKGQNLFVLYSKSCHTLVTIMTEDDLWDKEEAHA